jgi:hypothetical protein
VELVRRHPLWVIAGLGLAIRVTLAFTFYGNGDIFVYQIFGGAFRESPLHAYRLNVEQPLPFPYPPAYLLWGATASWIVQVTGLPFHGIGNLLPIVVDLGIAIAVYVYLGWRGAVERLRVGAFAVVMLGPVFVAISGFHGQFDMVAALPGVLGLMAWERRPLRFRAVESGLLVGLGALVKTVPMLLMIPLAATARSWREGATLLAVRVALLVVVSLPFYLAEPQGFERAFSYAGVPSRGGLSLIADPAFAVERQTTGMLLLPGLSPEARFLSRNASEITGVALLGLAAFLFRYRPAPVDGAVLLWLTVFVFSPNFFLHYLLWALPFFIMAGYVKETALLQVYLIPALIVTYVEKDATPTWAGVLYVAVMAGLWAFWVAALVIVARRVVRGRERHREGVQPPLVGMAVGHGGA